MRERDRYHRMPVSDQTIGRRLNRETDSCIVTYERDDGLGAVVVGYGDSFNARVADADSQLPRGDWLRLSISTPASIYSDLIGRDADVMRHEFWHGRAFSRHEGQRVIVGTCG